MIDRAGRNGRQGPNDRAPERSNRPRADRNPAGTGQDGGMADADSAPGEAVRPAELRRAGLIALGLLLALNVTDLVLTRLLLDRGGVELNPLADRLLASNSALWVKVALVAALAVYVVRQEPRLTVLCFMWLVVGIYVLVVVINGSQLASVWG
jgi:hypothetical protein